MSFFICVVGNQKVLGAKFDDGSAALGGALVFNKRLATAAESAASVVSNIVPDPSSSSDGTTLAQESETAEVGIGAREISLQQARLVFSQ